MEINTVLPLCQRRRLPEFLKADGSDRTAGHDNMSMFAELLVVGVHSD